MEIVSFIEAVHLFSSLFTLYHCLPEIFRQDATFDTRVSAFFSSMRRKRPADLEYRNVRHDIHPQALAQDDAKDLD